MTYDAKPGPSDTSVAAFLDQIDPPQRQTEARRLVTLFAEATGFAPKVQSHGIVGFGSYAYTYDSGHSGTSMATGFAPRKAELSLYILPGIQDFAAILARLGPHRTGKACLYIKHLDRIDEGALRELISQGLAALNARWPVTPT